MIPDGQRMILTVEHAREKIPTKPSGNAQLLDHSDYTAIVTQATDASTWIAVTVLLSIGLHRYQMTS